MMVKFSGNDVVIEKKAGELDRLADDFVSALDSAGIKYALVSGYVSILFGRSRNSEDIDVITERADGEKFNALWKVLMKRFSCLNAESPEEAYKDYLLSGHALRFARKGAIIPNMEMKFTKNELDRWTIENRRHVLFNGKDLFISPPELQIPFKLFLGGEKDIEDARHLHKMLKGNIKMDLMQDFIVKLKVDKLYKKYIA